MQPRTPPNDIITVVRDPKHTLGKRIDQFGQKSSNVAIGFAYAIQRRVDTPEQMAQVLAEVADDEHKAIINSSFPSIPVDIEFVILSEAQFKFRLGIQTREQMVGRHTLNVDGTNFPVVGRFKENTLPSNWQLLDRDIDEHTPKQFADLSVDEWLDELELLLPGLKKSNLVIVPSASARITKNGKAIGKRNVHVWVQVEDASDVERVRTALLLKSMELGKAWPKPKLSRADGSVVGSMIVCNVDHTVWSPGRLAFEGKPSVVAPYGVLRTKPIVRCGHRLDTSLLVSPDRHRVPIIGKQYGVSMRMRESSDSAPVIDCANLKFDTELQLNDGECITVRDVLPRLEKERKIRCQAPFRDSNSMAAFISKSKEGKPFVHDSGTNINHWLNDSESASLNLTSLTQSRYTLQEAREAINGLDPIGVEAKFAELALDLSHGDRSDFLRDVKKVTGKTLQVLNSYVKDAAVRRSAAMIDQQVGARTPITYVASDTSKMAELAEQAIVSTTSPQDYMSFGGRLARVVQVDTASPANVGEEPKSFAIEPLDDVGVRSIVERHVVFQVHADGKVKNIAVPDKVIDNLIRKKEHSAPLVKGLLAHPTVFRDGTIFAGPGLHESARVLYVGDPIYKLRPYSKRDAATALKRIRRDLLVGFEFASDLDAFMAIAMLFTGIVRRVLPIAPGFAIVAPVQASGKTTLARVVNVILSGKELSVSKFPEGDENEMQKFLLALFVSGVSMICLDNITDGLTFRSSTLAQCLTATVIIGRLLGTSIAISCPTNTLLVVTGNNLTLGADEATRWIPVGLDTQSARPHQRQFAHPDVVQYGRSIRTSILRDAIGIMAGFMKYGKLTQPVTRFPDWDVMVRQSLIWAGGADAADAFNANVSNSSSVNAVLALVLNLEHEFHSNQFTAVELAQKLAAAARHNGNTLSIPMSTPSPVNGVQVQSSQDHLLDIIGALGELKAKDYTKAGSVGRALSAIKDRPVESGGQVFVLRSTVVNGTTRYRVETL